MFNDIPLEISTPEITLDVSEDEKFEIIERLAQDKDFLHGATVHKIDGLRLEFDQGWCLIRASNTTPKLTLRFAAESDVNIHLLKQRVKAALTKCTPNLSTAKI